MSDTKGTLDVLRDLLKRWEDKAAFHRDCASRVHRAGERIAEESLAAYAESRAAALRAAIADVERMEWIEANKAAELSWWPDRPGEDAKEWLVLHAWPHYGDTAREAIDSARGYGAPTDSTREEASA